MDSESLELGKFLTADLGLEILRLRQLDASSLSTVFRADLASGRSMLVKVANRDGGRALTFLTRHAGHPLLARPLLPRPARFGERYVTLFEWKEMKHVPIEEMNDRQFASFRAALEELIGIMREDEDLCDRLDFEGMLGQVMSYADGLGAIGRRLLKPLTSLRPEDCLYPEKVLQTPIHGDFHPGNVGFAGDEVNAVIDFDCIIYGRPVEPLVYSAGKSIRFALSKGRRDRLIRRIEEMVVRSGRPAQEWRVAVNRARIRDVILTIRRRPVGSLKVAWNIYRRDRRMRRMLEAIEG